MMTVPPLANARELASSLDSLSMFLVKRRWGTATLVSVLVVDVQQLNYRC